MAEADTFKSLVREAFITPLRSVLIVDDQYPTWEEIFNSKNNSQNHSEQKATNPALKKWREPNVADEVLRLIREFRCQKPGFIIDIHDGISANATTNALGSETPNELADHLHQSDLLVLDYNLEGSSSGTGGDIARKILSSVLNNQHFNLVVVHTSEDLNNVMHECILALLKSCTSQYDDQCKIKINEIENIITDYESSEDFDRNQLKDKLDLSSYIQARHPDFGLKNALSEFMSSKGAFANLGQWAHTLNLRAGDKKYFFSGPYRLLKPDI